MPFQTHVTLDHKTSHKSQFLETEIYTSLNKISFNVWFVRIGQDVAEIKKHTTQNIVKNRL